MGHVRPRHRLTHALAVKAGNDCSCRAFHFDLPQSVTSETVEHV